MNHVIEVNGRIYDVPEEDIRELLAALQRLDAMRWDGAYVDYQFMVAVLSRCIPDEERLKRRVGGLVGVLARNPQFGALCSVCQVRLYNENGLRNDGPAGCRHTYTDYNRIIRVSLAAMRAHWQDIDTLALRNVGALSCVRTSWPYWKPPRRERMELLTNSNGQS